MSKLVGDPRPAKATEVEQGAAAAAQNKHVARGKLLPRDRVAQLLDPGTPFLKTEQFAAHAMYDGDAPSAGVIARIGRVQGVDCIANDATVKGMYLLSDDGEETPARTRDRAAEPLSSVVLRKRTFRSACVSSRCLRVLLARMFGFTGSP